VNSSNLTQITNRFEESRLSMDDSSSDGSSRLPNPFYPNILLAGDNASLADLQRRTLVDAGFTVDVADSYSLATEMWEQSRHTVILLDVSHARAVNDAVVTALKIKRRDPGQFVGYLADPILRTSGLAGDAIFPRSAFQLPQVLRKHFADSFEARI
jgi:CheY-like chemotaxis protein